MKIVLIALSLLYDSNTYIIECYGSCSYEEKHSFYLDLLGVSYV